MRDLNQLIVELQATISQLSATAELGQKQLEDSLTDAHKLILAANQAAAAVEDENLQAFLTATANLLEQLIQFAPAVVATEVEKLPKPAELLEQVTRSYQIHIDPLIQQAQKVDMDDAQLEQWTAIASLGIQVFNTCSEVLSYSGEMNTREKVYAMSGTVLMVAGVGLLVATTLNPHISIPAIAALTLVTLGCYLCQKAIARHKNTPAQKVQDALYKQSQIIHETATVFHEENNYPRGMLIFRNGTPQPTPATAVQEPKEQKSLGQMIMSGLKNLLGGGSNQS